MTRKIITLESPETEQFCLRMPKEIFDKAREYCNANHLKLTKYFTWVICADLMKNKMFDDMEEVEADEL